MERRAGHVVVTEWTNIVKLHYGSSAGTKNTHFHQGCSVTVEIFFKKELLPQIKILSKMPKDSLLIMPKTQHYLEILVLCLQQSLANLSKKC